MFHEIYLKIVAHFGDFLWLFKWDVLLDSILKIYIRSWDTLLKKFSEKFSKTNGTKKKKSFYQCFLNFFDLFLGFLKIKSNFRKCCQFGKDYVYFVYHYIIFFVTRNVYKKHLLFHIIPEDNCITIIKKE